MYLAAEASDIIHYFHRYIAVVALGLILAHPAILVSDNPAILSFLNPVRAPWQLTAGLASILALTALMIASWWRKRLGLHYDAWRRWHSALAIAPLGLALAHIGGVGHYVAAPLQQGFFAQVLQVARDLGTLRVGRIALDGTKVKANASKQVIDQIADEERQVIFRQPVPQAWRQQEVLLGHLGAIGLGHRPQCSTPVGAARSARNPMSRTIARTHS